MQLIALTGGIASGKSTIGRKLAELGAEVIDADQLAREAVAPHSPGLAAVVHRFGAKVLGADGALDRPRLGAIVFGDAAALSDLNGIVHPEVHRLFVERVREIEVRDPSAVVVYEIPLLAESGRRDEWSLVVVAEASIEQRIARMVELRGMTEADAKSRLSHQASDADRRSLADVIIDTSGTPADTDAQVTALWDQLHRS